MTPDGFSPRPNAIARGHWSGKATACALSPGARQQYLGRRAYSHSCPISGQSWWHWPASIIVEIALAAVADAANVSAEGKLNILGTFDTIPTRAVPVNAPGMVLAITFRLEYEDGGRSHPVAFELVDEDGVRLVSGNTAVCVGRIAPGMFQHVNVVTPFDRKLCFERAGRYRVRVSTTQDHFDVVFQVVVVE